jgi:hypothetical protein
VRELIVVCQKRPEPKGVPWDVAFEVGFQLLKGMDDVFSDVRLAEPGTVPTTEEAFPLADAFLHHFVYRQDGLTKKEIAWLIPVVATFVQAANDYPSHVRHCEKADPELIEAIEAFSIRMERYLTMLEIAHKAGLRIYLG